MGLASVVATAYKYHSPDALDYDPLDLLTFVDVIHVLLNGRFMEHRLVEVEDLGI